MNLVPLILISFFYLYGFFLLYITYFALKKGERGAFINNLAISLVFLTALTVNLIFISSFKSTHQDFIVFPFDLLTLGFIFLFIPFFYWLILREKKKIEQNNKVEILSKPKELPFKYDIYRKLTHLVVLGIVFFYFTLGFLIQILFINLLVFFPDAFSELFYSFFTFEINMIFTQYLVIYLVGISVLGLLTAEFVRILKPEIYPLKPVNQLLREKELHTRLGPHISMSIGCFSIIIVFGLIQPLGPLIICTSMTMAILSDIASNVIGRKIGKKKIRNTNKTWEGLIAGIVVAFLSGIITLLFLRWFYETNLLAIILLPLIGSLIIGCLDFIDLEIDDNLSYNVLTTITIFFIAYLII